MTAPSRLRIGVLPCGCLHESSRRWRVLRHWRCEDHSERFVRAEVVRWRWRRCESCRRRWARCRVTFGDGAAWLVCFGCELPGSTP